MDTLFFIASKLATFLLRAKTWEALLLACALLALVSGRIRAARELLTVELGRRDGNIQEVNSAPRS